jgi:methionyl-tRNA formyltransferase
MLRLAFMGTPDFAVPALAELIAAGHDIAAVYTQPPRPAGRGQALRPSPLEVFARGQGLPVFSPLSLKAPEVQEEFRALALDAAVVAAYGLILPRAVLEAPQLGCFNIHASLLPRWRGAAPIQRAIMAGDAETGVTIMRMEAGLDTGPMLLVERVPIGPRMNTGALHDGLAAIGASLMVRALSALERGTLAETPQPAEGVAYAAKITKEESALDWRAPASVLDRTIRALSPHPGAWFALGETRVRILDAEPVRGSGAPGLVLDGAPTIACGEGALRVLILQRAGRAPMQAAEFLRGLKLPPGTRLG